MKLSHVLLVLGVLVLSGCQAPPGSTLQCIDDICLPDPTTRDARRMLEEYGLRQITMDGAQEFVAGWAGNLVVWQAARYREGDRELVDNIMGYDIQTGDLIPIGTGDALLQTAAFSAKGRVVYKEEPQSGDPQYGLRGSYLVLWNATTRESRELDVGLGGEQVSQAFDGEWVVFRNRGSQNASENAIWAYHVDDERLVHLYTPLPGGEYPDGSLEVPSNEFVYDGTAYYTLRRVNPERTERNTTLYEAQLETGEQRVVYFGPQSIVDVLRRGNHLVAAGDGRIWIHDPATLELTAISGPHSGNVAIGGEWIVYMHTEGVAGISPLVFQFIAHHLPTNQSFVLLAGNGRIGGISTGAPNGAGTDGIRVALVVNRDNGEFWETLGTDLYWRELPEIG